jgi:Domain of unknown function (DUF4136)
MRPPANLMVVLACALAAGVALAGASVNVTTQHDPSVDFTKLRTYRWLPTPLYQNQQSAETRDPQLAREALDEPIRKAVERGLGANKFKQVSSTGTPDFHVLYYAAFGAAMDVNVLGAQYGYRPGWGAPVLGTKPTTTPQQLDEGTLVVDLLRGDRAVAIWRGTATGTVERTRTDAERRKTIETAVSEMFAKFPRPR